MDELCTQILASDQLAVVKRNHTQLQSIDQDDWSEAKLFLASKLHGALAGRWELRK